MAKVEMVGGVAYIGDHRLSDLVDAMGGPMMAPVRAMDQAFERPKPTGAPETVTAETVALDAAALVSEIRNENNQ